MSIFDGVKLRQMVFHSKKEKVSPKKYGVVEAVCLESPPPLHLREQEGHIRNLVYRWREKDSDLDRIRSSYMEM